MSIPLNIVIRVEMTNKPIVLAQVLTIIDNKGGLVKEIQIISQTQDKMVRDLNVTLTNEAKYESLMQELDNITSLSVIKTEDCVFMKHLDGKIDIKPKSNVENNEDLGLVYTPGVAKVCHAINQNPDLAYRYTMKNNSVAIVTDGTAILGLGNLGAAPALPVIEGKAVLFKQFANINAIPICLDTQDPEEIIKAVTYIAPAFGGINLEDIAAPNCFDIENRLREKLDIPVFHDDQHGTAIVVLAGLLNALKVVGKTIDNIKVVMSGAGAAGGAIAQILLSAGVKNLTISDKDGVISRDNLPNNPFLAWLANHTNEACVHGTIKNIITGADVFIGVSAPNVINREDVLKMNSQPIIFALANPVPEIDPENISDIAGVIATGRSDYPNQVNNALAFPGVFRGALDCHASTINDEMCVAAAHALSNIISPEELNAKNIIPSVFNKNVTPSLAQAIIATAKETGVARNKPTAKDVL